jgi:hypothetical protein
MKLWEALKAVQKGKKVRMSHWENTYIDKENWFEVLYTMGPKDFSSKANKKFFEMLAEEEWEIYEGL